MGRWGFGIVVWLWAGMAAAGEVSVAVASSFLSTADKIAQAFTKATGHTVVLTDGSTEALFIQISGGASFDVFLSADDARPASLLDSGQAVDTRAYAVDAVALVSRVPVEFDAMADAVAGKVVALADPTASPYGRASTRAMEKLSLDTGKFRPLVLGNVDQVATVFIRGDADLAFVSAARADRLGAPFVLTLDAAVPPISHSAALLSDDEASQAFWDWLATQDARAMIAADGYSLP